VTYFHFLRVASASVRDETIASYNRIYSVVEGLKHLDPGWPLNA